MIRKLLKFTDNKFYYTDNDYITLSQTNFPAEENCFKTGRYKQFYWEIEITYYDKQTKTLTAQVSDYNPEDIDQFSDQTRNETINRIVFKEFEWQKLEKFLSMYKRESLWPLCSVKSKLIYESKMDGYRRSFNVHDQFDDNDNDATVTFKEDTENPDREPREYNERFSYYIKDANFSNGYVTISKKFNFHSSKIEIKIFNKNICAEYNYIKAFIQKVFKRETLTIVAKIAINGHDNITVEANSPEIDRIDENFIQKINHKLIRSAYKIKYNSELKKGILTASEFLSANDSLSQAGNVFKQDEKEIIKSLLTNFDIWNKKQIKYLSGYSLTEKIMITQKPHIGFIFIISGYRKYIYCWELLESHATYLWICDNEISSRDQLNHVNNEIILIQENGRKYYREAQNRILRGPARIHVFSGGIEKYYVKNQ